MVNINIPLPTSCASCPLSVRHFGKLYCPPLNDRVGNEGKDDRCPLMDAKGRGDLISRQAIMKEFADFVRKSNNSDFAQAPTWNDAVSLVGSMPSAQPERTGKWEAVKRSDGISIDFRCSVCHRFRFHNGALRRYKWCPECGARMKEGEERD